MQWLGVEVWEVGGKDEEQLGEKMGRDQGEVGEGYYVIMMMVMVMVSDGDADAVGDVVRWWC